MPVRRAERQITVEATPQQCFDALIDFESYPQWQGAVHACEVHSRDRDGRGKRVSFEIDAKVKAIHYVLDYSYEAPHLITWDFVEGDVKDIDGEYVLEDRGDGTTLATYALRIDAGMFLPGRLASVVGEQVMQRSVEELKTHVEGG